MIHAYRREHVYQLSPRVTLKRGDGVKVRGIRGVCSFIGITTNLHTDQQWADVYAPGRGGHRSVNPDRLLKRKTKP